MKPDISEFSFGYAVVEEYMRSLPPGIGAAPLFPTQASEGKTGGFDVQLQVPGGPLFLQFKRSDYMTRNAVGIEKFPGGFYRMHLYSRDGYRQHELMSELENDNNEVYYCAPRFWRYYQLDEAYRAGTVVERSIFFRPSAIPLEPGDGAEHTLSYDDESDFGWFRSTPRQIRAASVHEVREAAHRLVSGESLEASLQRALGTLRAWTRRSGIPEDWHHPEQTISPREDLLEELARLGKIVAGCECVLVWRQKS